MCTCCQSRHCAVSGSFGDALFAVTRRLEQVPVSARGAVEGALPQHIRFVVTPKVASRAGFEVGPVANDEVVSSDGECIDCRKVAAVAGRVRKWREIPSQVRGREQFRLSTVLPSRDRWPSRIRETGPTHASTSRKERDAHVA